MTFSPFSPCYPGILLSIQGFAKYPGFLLSFHVFLCLVKGNIFQRLGSMAIGNGGVDDT